jgi:hypothetical protein
MSGRGVGLLPAERESHGHGIRAGWEPDRCHRRRKALQTRLFSIRSRGDLRSSWPDGSLAGFSGYDRLFAGIPVRDLRGMKTSRRSSAPNPATKHADLQGLYGSDGTRTRDLRRDRPVLLVPGCPGICGDLPLQQAFSALAFRALPGVGGSVRRPPAGCARDAVVVSLGNERHKCGMVASTASSSGRIGTCAFGAALHLHCSNCARPLPAKPRATDLVAARGEAHT